MLKLQLSASVIAHPDKERAEDAASIADSGVFVIADGVGGCREVGIDAGAFARELVECATEHAASTSSCCVDPLSLIDYAWRHARSPGSSTMLAASLAHDHLRWANLGDSAFCVFRAAAAEMMSTPDSSGIARYGIDAPPAPPQSSPLHRDFSAVCDEAARKPRAHSVITVPTSPVTCDRDQDDESPPPNACPCGSPKLRRMSLSVDHNLSQLPAGGGNGTASTHGSPLGVRSSPSRLEGQLATPPAAAGSSSPSPTPTPHLSPDAERLRARIELLAASFAPTARLECIFQCARLQHAFNFPYQLTSLRSLLDVDSHELRYVDTPAAHAVCGHLRLRAGDIIVAGTDGLWDNLFLADIMATVQAQYAPAAPEHVAHIAAHLARAALVAGRSADTRTPFAEAAAAAAAASAQAAIEAAATAATETATISADEARAEAAAMGVPREGELRDHIDGAPVAGAATGTGGKCDDVTVVVGQVVTRQAIVAATAAPNSEGGLVYDVSNIGSPRSPLYARAWHASVGVGGATDHAVLPGTVSDTDHAIASVDSRPSPPPSLASPTLHAPPKFHCAADAPVAARILRARAAMRQARGVGDTGEGGAGVDGWLRDLRDDRREDTQPMAHHAGARTDVAATDGARRAAASPDEADMAAASGCSLT